MPKIIIGVIGTVLLMAGAAAHAEGDPAKGKVLYTTCQACHGAKAEGNEQLNAPALTGLQDWYIIRQLKNFKEGIRGSNPEDIYGAQMRPMAMTLPDDQAIEDVTAYILTLGEGD
ncbi:MAG: c-type cytochrome [Xanthomonadales bacterium]|nr:c-type cytochrome [Xanthomonadales bacterium]